MADQSPGGAIVSFGGVPIASLPHVAGIGFPDLDEQSVEAYAQSITGLPVDLLNGADAPYKAVFSCDIFIRADDTTPAPAAWGEVMDGVRALKGLPEVGVLVVSTDASAGATVSCQARRKRFPTKLTPANARHYTATLVFTCTTPWGS